MHLSASTGQAMLLATWTPTTFLTSTRPGVGALVTRQCPRVGTAAFTQCSCFLNPFLC